MSHNASKLVRALSSAIAVDEFIASEIRTRAATETHGKLEGRSEGALHRLQAQLFVDRKRGRGAASFLPTVGTPLAPQVQEASTRAFEALGPAWQLPQPAAPARVLVHDTSDNRTPRDVARAVIEEFRATLPKTVRALTATATVHQSKHRTILSNGFDNQYLSTDIWFEAMVQATDGSPVPIRLRARRLANMDLAIQGAIERAQQRSLQDAKAAPVAAGMVDLVLVHSAYLPLTAQDFGIWTPMVEQAKASRVRAGISTHNPGQPLVEGSNPGDALTIRSEGTEPYGLRCAPFSIDGQAVRNFTLAEEGLVTGVAIGHRDSALGAGVANGGIRRLVIEGGSQPAEQITRPESRPLLVVQSIGALETNANGHLLLDVESAEMRTRDTLGHVVQSSVRSAIISGNLRDWLGRARISQESVDDSWLYGPSHIRINSVRIH